MPEFDTTPAEMNEAEVRSRCEQAADAARRMATASPANRADWLEATADALETCRSDLVALADDETALGQPRLDGELTRTTNQLRMFATIVRAGGEFNEIVEAESDATPALRRMAVPVGPVAVFAASNFPFAFSVAGGDTASALAVGCPVLVKVNPGHPRLSFATGSIVESALVDAGAPPSAFSLVHGFDAGRHLVLDPAVRAVAFTGSQPAGRSLFDLAAGRPDPIPFYGELGSINPVIVTEAALDARPAEIASGLAASFTLGVGQFCTKPGIAIVPAGRDVADLIASETPTEPLAMLTDTMTDNFRRTYEALAQRPGVERTIEPAGTGRSTTPALLRIAADDFVRDSAALTEECFGPCTLLVEYSEAKDVQRVIDVLPGSLTATIHAEPVDNSFVRAWLPRLVELAGRLIWNGWPTGVAVTAAQHHGGPWPATTDPLHTSVGAAATSRFLRPVTFQNWPDELLPCPDAREPSV